MRPAQDIIADLASAGLSAAQLALVIELSAAVAVEARPVVDQAAERRRAKDREYQAERRHNRQKSADTPTLNGSPHEVNNLPPSDSPLVISKEIPPPHADPELKPEHVVEVWNDLGVRYGLPLVKKITPERRKKLNTFIRRHSIDDITEAISAIPHSPFLLGENQRGWKADFDWFLEPRNFTKLSEGNYVH